MVTELGPETAPGQTWILQPTRSMTWPQAKRFIWLVVAFSFAIGGTFAWLGLPLVMPFSGLEAAAVALAFYLVLRDGERQELVRLDDEHLVIECGARKLERRFEFHRAWVRVDLRGSPYRYHPTRLFIGSHGRAVELGRFLTDHERETFSRSLVNALKKNR